MDRPWFQFHTRDWLDNKELRRCSLASRAILADLLCIAHEGVMYGFLVDKIGPLTESYLASRCHVSVRQFRSCWIELLSAERIHEEEGTGRFFIKRMVEDEKTRIARAAGGIKGGNPDLTGKVPPKVNLTPNLEVNLEDNQPLARADVPRSDSASEGVVVNGFKEEKKVAISKSEIEVAAGVRESCFQEIIGYFLAAGCTLTEGRIYSARSEWESVKPEEFPLAIALARDKARKNDARFMGWPANFIRAGDWNARGPGRILPEPLGKSDLAQELAERNFMRKRGLAT